jgi:hypothetical protein
MTFVTVVLLSGSVLAASEDAIAAPPAACSAVPAARAYNAGIRSGESLTDSAWAGIAENPDRLDELKRVVLAAVRSRTSLPPGASVVAQCRFAGFLQGTLDELAVLQDLVVQQCILDGDFFGDFMGNVYCDVSEGLGGLGNVGVIVRPTNPGTCGVNYQRSCDANFNSTAAANVGCGPYLTGAFLAVVNEYRNNQCTY